jgi:hypothetical protein
VADVPDQLVLKVARDREGKRDVVARRVALSAGQISFIPKSAS